MWAIDSQATWYVTGETLLHPPINCCVHTQHRKQWQDWKKQDKRAEQEMQSWRGCPGWTMCGPLKQDKLGAPHENIPIMAGRRYACHLLFPRSRLIFLLNVLLMVPNLWTNKFITYRMDTSHLSTIVCAPHYLRLHHLMQKHFSGRYLFANHHDCITASELTIL